jgi:hypothetical protein
LDYEYVFGLCFFQVEVQPVSKHVAHPDRGCEHQGGCVMVRRQAHGVHLQGEGKEQRYPLPVHLGQGHQASW